MIIQALLNWFSNQLAHLVGIIPSLPPSVQTGMEALPGQLQSLGTSVGRLAPILPFDMITSAVVVVGVGIVAALGIHLILKIISFVTLGGGAT